MFSDDQPIRAVSVRDLNRHTGEVLREVRDGARVVVLRHGRPDVLIVSVEDGADLLVAGSKRFAVLRREAREELESDRVVVYAVLDSRKMWRELYGAERLRELTAREIRRTIHR